MIQVFTVAAPARAPEIRLLVRSLDVALPAARFLWAVPGPIEEAHLDGLDAVEVSSLEAMCPSGPERPGPRAAGAAEIDLALTVPDVALSLLRRPGCEGVLYLAPQVVSFSSISELIPGGGGGDVVLVPTVLRPEPAVPEDPPAGELRSLRQGVFSTSAVAVAPAPSAERFLRWWGERARSIVPPPGARHDLRPWLNLAPALFTGVRVLRSPAYGVGRENLRERRVEGSVEDGLTVDGDPLAYFDFSGLADGSLEAAVAAGRGDRRTLDSLLRWCRDRRRGAGVGAARADRARAGLD